VIFSVVFLSFSAKRCYNPPHMSHESHKNSNKSFGADRNGDLSAGQAGKIIVKGARTHNLKNITVEMPRNRMIAITGLSGSGKSSLAFDTIFCRRTEALCRVSFGVCAAIFASHAKA